MVTLTLSISETEEERLLLPIWTICTTSSVSYGNGELVVKIVFVQNVETSMTKVTDFHLSTLVSYEGPRNSQIFHRQVSLISAIIQSGTKWIKLKIYYFGQFPRGTSHPYRYFKMSM